MRNRIRALTRWPLDRGERIELARLDVEYCEAIARMHYPLLEGGGATNILGLNHVWRASTRVLVEEGVEI
ncbi:MAG TPA: hypothetical protein VG713_08835 [Pirellulales bacterium]|nr:hypothetical protein [Pirellulales bacterium]